MNKKILAISLAVAVAGFTPVISAEEGNGSAGKAKAGTCAGCHGEDGNSLVPTYPKLAGQHVSYLVNQLRAFKGGTRNNAMMGPMAAALSDDDMADIAAYYNEQKISQNPAPALPPPDDEDAPVDEQKNKEIMGKLLAKGGDLYRNGNLKNNVSACIACHGPFGEGNRPAAFPAVYSQHADYLIKTLADFKSGERSNNPENMMHMIAQKMTEEEIKAVSYYISTMKQ